LVKIVQILVEFKTFDELSSSEVCSISIEKSKHIHMHIINSKVKLSRVKV